MNAGVTIFDRFHRVVFATSWINAQFKPLWLRNGEVVFAAFRIRIDLEAGTSYVLAFGAPLKRWRMLPLQPAGTSRSAGRALCAACRAARC